MNIKNWCLIFCIKLLQIEKNFIFNFFREENARKENDFIYHEKVSKVQDLEKIEGVVMVLFYYKLKRFNFFILLL